MKTILCIVIVGVLLGVILPPEPRMERRDREDRRRKDAGA